MVAIGRVWRRVRPAPSDGPTRFVGKRVPEEGPRFVDEMGGLPWPLPPPFSGRYFLSKLSEVEEEMGEAAASSSSKREATPVEPPPVPEVEAPRTSSERGGERKRQRRRRRS